MDGDDELTRDELLPLRVACAIGVADSLVALSTAIVSRPFTSSIVIGIAWVAAWAAALATVPRWAGLVRAHAWWLAPLALVALLPAIRDGGYPGNLATQPQWIALVAAAAAGLGPALACGAAVSGGKLAIFLATGTSATALAPWGGETSEATTATLAPIAIALLGVVGVTVLRRVLAASAVPTPVAPQPVEAPAPRLSPAERAVVALLADGLTPKQIAHARGTSVETVRTQIKRAKRATAARTLDELVASAWRPS